MDEDQKYSIEAKDDVSEEESFFSNMVLYFNQKYGGQEEVDELLRQCCVGKGIFIAWILESHQRHPVQLFRGGIVAEACESDSVSIQDWFKRILKQKKDPNISLDNETELLSEHFLATVDVLFSNDYEAAGDLMVRLDHLIVASLIYLGMGFGSMNIPAKEIFKLDLACFDLIWCAGNSYGCLYDAEKHLRHSRTVVRGKQKQKRNTIDKILKCYKSLGTQWCEDGSNKPILLKGVRVAINKLAGEIYINLDGDVTQRHIASCLKELHEKGEI